ncbi:GNAT family N-acetyltransferase [Actinoplanes sp. NPDC023714]|uniref:GNAT family N-acetyltransferase n=1 Tax=Actinoplanes sp. NPDC023714 TaxID=3154322 RepID=UPI0033EE4B7A
MTEVSVRFLEGEADAGVLRRLYDTVIGPSFAPEQREPFERLRRVLAADDLRGAVALAADGEPVGALFLEWFPDIRAALLCYFAVRPDLRGRGIGRELVAVAGPRWRAALEPRVVLAEAEDPAIFDDAGEGDYGDGGARLRLYAGFGARRLPIPYLMPELAPGAGRLPGLLLLVIETEEPGDRLPGELVAGFLERYFARLEGDAADPADTRLPELLTTCRSIGSLPMTET